MWKYLVKLANRPGLPYGGLWVLGGFVAIVAGAYLGNYLGS